jgi:hypothetical protein
VGADVDIGDIPNLLGRMMVGRFSGKIVSPSSLNYFLYVNWSGILGYHPIFCMWHTCVFFSNSFRKRT